MKIKFTILMEISNVKKIYKSNIELFVKIIFMLLIVISML